MTIEKSINKILNQTFYPFLCFDGNYEYSRIWASLSLIQGIRF